MSSDVAETTSLLTNSPMENADVSTLAAINGIADFILGSQKVQSETFSVHLVSDIAYTTHKCPWAYCFLWPSLEPLH